MTGDTQLLSSVPLPDTTSAFTIETSVTMTPPTTPPLSTRLPAFPPHAVVKAVEPAPESAVEKSAEDTSAATDGEPLGEGLRWKPRAKVGAADAEKPAVAIRGKGDVKKYGWGHLPPQLMRIVLSHATAEIPPLPQLRRRWGQYSTSYEIIAALSARRWLAEIRRVSMGWRAAIDTHPFWWQLIRTLYPNYDPQVADAQNSRITLTSSRSGSATAVKAGPTPFKRAQRVSNNVCIPCRLEYHAHREVNPAQNNLTLFVENLGWVHVCQWHDDQCCASCLLSEALGRNGAPVGNLHLFPAADGEVDERDEYRSIEAMICRQCRTMALDAAILRQLRSCARGGGFMRGDKIEWRMFPEYREYTKFGNDTARYTAETLVSRWALTCQARFRELLGVARELQTMEYFSRLKFYHGEEPETLEGRSARWSLLRAFQPHLMLDPRRDQYTRNRLYEAWEWEGLQRGVQAVVDDMREDQARPTINEKWGNLLHETVMSDFLYERFRTGIWVLPSAEADVYSCLPRQAAKPVQPSPPSPTTPLLELIASASHPFPHHPTTEHMAKPSPFGLGVFRLDTPYDIASESILPPAITIQTMDERYMVFMRRQLAVPMRRLVADIVDMVGNEESAEEICQGMGIKEVLEGLRNEEVWLKPGASTRRALQLAMDAMPEEGPKLPSPRVELVVEEEKEEVPSVVQIIHEEPVVVPKPPSTSLGKRKSPPAELPESNRPAKGSRESSAPLPVSASEVATTSSTPEDVVMPITPEEPPVETLGEIPEAEEKPSAEARPKTETPETLETLESISKLAVKMNGDAPQGVSKGVEVEVEMEEGDDESSLTESDEVGRGADGHYEEDEEDVGGYEDDELEMDRQMREENEMMDVAEAEEEEEEELMEVDVKPGANGTAKPQRTKSTRSYTPSASSSYEDDSSSSSLRSTPSAGVFPSTTDTIVHISCIPYIPLPATEHPDDPVLRFLAKDLIMDVWYDVRKHLRVCRCGICERARKREEAENAKVVK